MSALWADLHVPLSQTFVVVQLTSRGRSGNSFCSQSCSLPVVPGISSPFHAGEQFSRRQEMCYALNRGLSHYHRQRATAVRR